jgi:hypothetical protein
MLCFPTTCHPPILEVRGSVVLAGCVDGGALDSVCRIGCTSGFEASAKVDGHCSLIGSGVEAEYIGQQVTCAPEVDLNGQVTEAYCIMAAQEAVLDCCEFVAVDSGAPCQGSNCCSADVLPTECPVECAERWLPLKENCEQYLVDFQSLTSACDKTAEGFLGQAPSLLTVSGCVCHPLANGAYTLQRNTIAAKPYWKMTVGDQTFHLYSISVPHDSWVISFGSDEVEVKGVKEFLVSHILEVESYEQRPSWGEHVWKETCEGHRTQDTALTLTPGYTDSDCEEGLTLMKPELTAANCCAKAKSKDGLRMNCFEDLLTSGFGADQCGYDCAHLWTPFALDCATFMGRVYPGFNKFTELCATKSSEMILFELDANLTEHGKFDKEFHATQELVYAIEMVPDSSAVRTSLAIEAPYSHHVLASRVDVSRHGAGEKHIEWDAPETESHVDINVQSLEGSGNFHLKAEIIGTAQHMAAEAVLNHPPTLLGVDCHWFDDCTYHYNENEMRADGASFLLRYANKFELPFAGLVSFLHSDTV